MNNVLNWKALPDRQETTVIKRIEVEGVVFDATNDLYGLLDELEDCDGFFTALTIREMA